jgi:hypothetical protein
MENDPEVIRQHMDDTRTSLTEKLEALESKVAEPVTVTVDAVTETVEHVKESVTAVADSVAGAVDSLKETFSVSRQFERNPWLMFGASVAVGLIGSRLVRSPRRMMSNLASAAGSAASEVASTAASAASHAASSAAGAVTPSWLSSSGGSNNGSGPSFVQETMGTLRGLAVGALMGLVRDMAAESLPGEIGKSVAESVDDLTTKLGGKRIAEVLPHGDEQQQQDEPSMCASEEEPADPVYSHGEDQPAGARNRRTARAGR